MKKINMSALDKAINIIRERKGLIRTSEAIKSGIHPRILYALRDSEKIEQVSRGLYRLTEFDALSNYDVVIVASRAPNAVLCLISALSFHELTTQIPHAVAIAIGRNSKIPKIHFPPVSVHRFSDESFSQGIEIHTIEGVGVRIYSAEKTLVDCFKFRKKIGMDVVLEALKFYKSRHKIDIGKLIEYARICRVEKIMMPYLEASL